MRRSWERARLALLILSPVLLIVLVVAIATSIALDSVGLPGEATADAGIAQIGDDLAFVIVTDGGASVTDTRALLANWGLLAPAVVLVIASFPAWIASGRIQSRLEETRIAVATADAERESRLQEVVHELRTPLAVMGTNLELAGFAREGSSNGYVDAARRAVDRMSRTVDDLAGHGRLSVEDGEEIVDLAEVGETVAAEQVGPCRARGVYLRLDGETLTLVGVKDRAALRTAASNFMSNAVRVAPRGSTITVSWGATDAWGWLAVSDEGPGLSPSHHARVFERGWQGAHARDRQEGSGLGLAIARQLTEAQGGAVTLSSEEGAGATFALWVPLRETARLGDIVASDGVHALTRPWESAAAIA